MLNDTLANALSGILNAERTGKDVCFIKPSSKIIKNVLKVMKENSYIGDFEEVGSERGGLIKVNLIGQINKCGVIKPRFSVKTTEIEKFEKRHLPAKGFGILILTTPRGIITQEEAIEKNTGGTLLAYCY